MRRVNTAVAVLIALVATFFLARDALTSAALFLVILIGLVMEHELAHYVTAKLFGVHVQEFGIGFPPRIAGKQIGETVYTVNWLPLGGFVKLLGEEDAAHPRSLAAQARWKRLVILASGSIVNLILPVLLFAIAFTIPHEESISRAIVTEVIADAPAEAAGFEPGDIIYEVGGRNAKNVSEAGRLIRLNLGKEIEIIVRRAGEFVPITVEPRWAPPEGQGPTGITITPQCTVVGGAAGAECVSFTERVALPPWESIPAGLQATIDSVLLARNDILSWFKGGGGPQAMGPIGIAQTTGEIAREEGLPTLFALAAILSLNLGVINLLPLPMLDGGRIMFLLIEVARRGKRIAPEKEAIVHLVGLVAFIALAIAVTFADITRIVNGDSVFR